MSRERRRHRRVPAKLGLRYLDLEEEAEATETNLSESGLFLPNVESLPLGRQLLVVISGPGLPQPVPVRARVARVAREGQAGGPGLGVVFEEVPPRETARLRGLIAAHSGNTVIVVGREGGDRPGLVGLLQTSGYNGIGADADDLLAVIDEHSVSAVLIDVAECPSWTDVVAAVRSRAAWVAVVLAATQEHLDAVAAQAGRMGVFDIVAKPVMLTQLLASLRGAIAWTDDHHHATGGTPTKPSRLVTKSPAMLQLAEEIAKVAPLDYPVVIQGETGVGKQLVAECLHHWSARASAPWIVADFGTVNPNLRESKLFGLEKGAFTGAVVQKEGWVERAGDGTLFLDEISRLDQESQARLQTS